MVKKTITIVQFQTLKEVLDVMSDMFLTEFFHPGTGRKRLLSIPKVFYMYDGSFEGRVFPVKPGALGNCADVDFNDQYMPYDRYKNKYDHGPYLYRPHTIDENDVNHGLVIGLFENDPNDKEEN